MSLIDTLQQNMKQALKSKDELTLSTIRLILSSVSYARIAKGSQLTDDEVIGVIVKEAKQRRETIESAISGGRKDIADREKAELDILQTYLPQQLDQTEIETIVRQIVAEVGATDIKDRGKVMGPLMQKVKGRADGKLVSQIVENVLRG
ncbi:GatB/YqeY domain-containing protein [bacterium]|nr:GatB/YqeY domain-containing protein [bacterium]